MLRALRPALAPAFLAVCLALAACGGGDDAPEQPSESPAKLLAIAAANPIESGWASIDLDAELDGDTPLAGAASAAATGPFARDPAGGLPQFEFQFDGELAGYGVDAELVSTGEDAYVVFFGENYRVGADRVAEFEARRPETSGLHPETWFVRPRYAGAEDVEGTETERIEAQLDGAAAAHDLGRLAAELGADDLAGALAEGGETGYGEAWVAYDDKTIRRLRVTLPFRVPPERLAETSGITGGSITLDASVSNVGEEVTVKPPEGGGFQPIDDLTGRLSDLASLAGL